MVKMYDKDRKHRIWEDPIFIFAGKANKGAPILQITSGRSGAMSSTDKQGNQTEPTQKNVQNTYNIIQPPIYAVPKKSWVYASNRTDLRDLSGAELKSVINVCQSQEQSPHGK